MKRILAFLFLTCLFVVIFTLPKTAAPAAVEHPFPVWSVLCYVAAVGIGAIAAFAMIHEQNRYEEAVMSRSTA